MVIYSFHKRACTLYIPIAGYALLSYFALRIAVLTYRRLREQDYVYCSTIVCAYMRSRYCFAVRPRFRVQLNPVSICFSILAGFFFLSKPQNWSLLVTVMRKRNKKHLENQPHFREDNQKIKIIFCCTERISSIIYQCYYPFICWYLIFL